MELSGHLASFPIAELLHWANNDQRTGALVVRAAGHEKRVYFQDGQITTCLTDEPSEFYGQFLLLSGYLDRETLYRCVSLCRERERRLGAVLEEEGIMDLADIQRTLRFHIEDVICDIFLWDHGVFLFRAEQPPREELLAEPIKTLGLALEGSHWSDEVKRIREDFVDDNIVLVRKGEPAPDRDLTPRQRRILAEVDGARRLEAIYGAVHGSFYRFLAATHELFSEGLLEIAHYGKRLHGQKKDAQLDELLWEQAVEEYATDKQRVASLGDLERFVPVWVRPPADAEWDRMPDPVRTFYDAFDGQRRLTDILSDQETEWQRQTELLMLQIGKEAVALLPAPIAQLRAEAADRDDQELWTLWDEVRRGSH